MSDEDWFERAVGKDDEAADVDPDDGADSEEDADPGDDTDPGDGADSDDETDPDDEMGPEGTNPAEESESSSRSEPAEEESTPDGDEEDQPGGGDDPALENFDPEPADAGSDADPPQATGSAPAADEGEDGGEGTELFEEDFTAALQEAEAEGFGAGGADPADPEFAMGTDAGGGIGDTGVPDIDGEPDSGIPRIDLGIEGLDEMIQGGVPERSLMVAIGSAGTGKSTIGLQFLEGGLSQGERAVFIALEESKERVIRSATEKGFPFDEYAEEGQLAVVDMDPVEMANSLQTIGSELPRLIEEFGAQRLVLDSVSLLEMMFDERAARRNEIYDFTKSLKESGVTTMLTSEASEETAYASRHGIVEYLTDAVFILQYVRPSDFRETRMAIEIQKIRDANHSRETKPYEITNEGIEVFRQANLF